MSYIDFSCERSQLINQKQQLESQRNSAYKEMSILCDKLNEQFEILYPFFKELDFFHFDIINVDFYFGEIACEYRGNNYSLSNKLFKLTENLVDINAFDLTVPQLVKIHNTLVALYHETFEQKFTVIKNHSLTTNEIIDKIEILTQHFSYKGSNDCDRISQELVNSVQKLYVLLDFALYEDVTHTDLRRLYSHYIEVESASYDKISGYDKALSKIDDLLDSLPNDIPNEQVSEKDSSEEKMTFKEKVLGMLGGFGVICFYLLRILIAVLPFVMIGGNFFLTLLLITINYWVPLTSVVFLVWGLVCAIQGVQDIWAILFYIIFIAIWIPFFISTIISVFQKRK